MFQFTQWAIAYKVWRWKVIYYISLLLSSRNRKILQGLYLTDKESLQHESSDLFQTPWS